MSQNHPQAAPSPHWFLALGALGVVYGDIGTSPLYALRECFHGPHAVEPTPANVLGVLSLVFWALIVVISIKYLVFIMRADNRGEGGILALMALVRSEKRVKSKRQWLLVALGLFGAALLYGDGMLTPAISVLSAVEGLEVATLAFKPYVVPITIGILIVLFAIQRRGTGGVGTVFGPITLLWFGVLAVLGTEGILRNPAVLNAVNPIHGLSFFVRNGVKGFLVLGGVTLVITGGEALYADMGHFGRRPIRLAWFVIVLPALLLNYFGQGAMLINNPEAAHNPFFRLAPEWALYPLVVLATVAACIASQAVISGAFSLTRQAVQLGFSPRVDIVHTSPGEIGQIYIPSVNWLLMICTIGLVVGFKKSTNLAAAYGIAVTATMVITTMLAFVVERKLWRWSLGVAGAFSTMFLLVDLSFFGANFVKVLQGGWFPLAVAAVIFTLMTTWKKGRQILAARLHATTLPFEFFMRDVEMNPPTRVPGTSVFMFGNMEGTPPALLHNLVHNKVLHERVVLLTVETVEIPRVPDAERSEVIPLGTGFYRVVLRYGFTENPDIPAALSSIAESGLLLKPMETSYFLGRETLIPSKNPGMATWREHLFWIMSRNARSATSFFGLPPNRVVELGAQIEL
jgi:KUP system potassium uptake protein